MKRKNITEIEDFDDNSSYSISEKHKQTVRERIEKYANRTESYLSWEEIESKIRFS